MYIRIKVSKQNVYLWSLLRVNFTGAGGSTFSVFVMFAGLHCFGIQIYLYRVVLMTLLNHSKGKFLLLANSTYSKNFSMVVMTSKLNVILLTPWTCNVRLVLYL